jgi:hypothetical protein
MTLNFRIPATGTRGWIDIAQAASIVNRRFYRQGLQWAVSSIAMTQKSATATTNTLRVETLPTTWVTSNAWHKAMAHWLKQQNDDADESGAESAIARYRDFKIFMDDAHVDDYYDSGGQNLNNTNLIPRYFGGAFSTGEWEPSEIVVPNDVADGTGSEVDPQEFHLHMVGPNYNAGHATRSRGIIDGYANSRALPQSPDPRSFGVPTDANWMATMFDVGNDNLEVLANAIDKNDDLPYNQVEYPGGEVNAPGLQMCSEFFMSGSGTINTRVVAPGFVAPCGLIKITNEVASGDSPEIDIQVNLVAGSHRGYLAEPMQDM